MEFKVETVKWNWADNVKNKEVYRDDEFIRTKSIEESLAAIEFFYNKYSASYYNYTITVFRNGEYFTYFRNGMPCWGGFVKYLDSHGDKYFMNPYFPRDISVAYPEGDTVLISAPKPSNVDYTSPLYEFIFSSESPWVSAFGSKDTIVFKNSYFVLTNMNTDPTVFYNLLRYGFHGYHNTFNSLDPRAQILAAKTPSCDPRRLAGQKPIRISGGTWAEGYGYTRPHSQFIFVTEIKVPLYEFRKVQGTYQTNDYTNKYFIEQMKEVFKLDVNKLHVSPGQFPKEKFEKPLVEAWDYFKEKSKELSDKLPPASLSVAA